MTGTVRERWRGPGGVDGLDQRTEASREREIRGDRSKRPTQYKRGCSSGEARGGRLIKRCRTVFEKRAVYRAVRLEGEAHWRCRETFRKKVYITREGAGQKKGKGGKGKKLVCLPQMSAPPRPSNRPNKRRRRRPMRDRQCLPFSRRACNPPCRDGRGEMVDQSQGCREPLRKNHRKLRNLLVYRSGMRGKAMAVS